MRACNSKTLIPLSLLYKPKPFSPPSLLTFIGTTPCPTRARAYTSAHGAVSLDPIELDDTRNDTVEQLISGGNRDDVSTLMKMERRKESCSPVPGKRWFPYLDRFECGGGQGLCLTSGEVLEAVGPHLMEERMERFRRVTDNRSYSVCLVVEGLSDFGNVSAAFRSADALGFQSVHVVSCDSSKRCTVT